MSGRWLGLVLATVLLPAATTGARADDGWATADSRTLAASLDRPRDVLVRRLTSPLRPRRIHPAIAGLERAVRRARPVVAAAPSVLAGDRRAPRELHRLAQGTAAARRAIALHRRAGGLGARRRPLRGARRQAAIARRWLRTSLAGVRALCCPPAPPVVAHPPLPPPVDIAIPGPPAPAPLPPYHVSGYRPPAVPVEDEPWHAPNPLALDAPRFPTNPDGTLRYELDGVDHPHPVAVESYALRMLNGHRLTGEPEYVRRAVVNTQRLLDHAVASRDGLYLAYTFPFDVFGNPAERLLPPWFSGMAQGRALILLHRLHEATGDARWRAAADRIHATVFHPRAAGHPWMAFVDADGYLWFEEYPSDAEPPRVLNGHISATIGYWKRARATGDPVARRLFDGGATTALRYAHVLRRPGQPSAYAVRTPVQDAGYHRLHIGQLRELALLTGDPAFDRIADDYAADSGGP